MSCEHLYHRIVKKRPLWTNHTLYSKAGNFQCTQQNGGSPNSTWWDIMALSRTDAGSLRHSYFLLRPLCPTSYVSFAHLYRPPLKTCLGWKFMLLTCHSGLRGTLLQHTSTSLDNMWPFHKSHPPNLAIVPDCIWRHMLNKLTEPLPSHQGHIKVPLRGMDG